jgi:hypothetical protein
MVTLIGFAAWLFLNLAENLEGMRPPQRRPTLSGRLHRMFVRDTPSTTSDCKRALARNRRNLNIANRSTAIPSLS